MWLGWGVGIMRVRARCLAQLGVGCTKLAVHSESTLPRQGNLQFYSTASVARRQALRYDKHVIAAVLGHWNIVATRKPNGASLTDSLCAPTRMCIWCVMACGRRRA